MQITSGNSGIDNYGRDTNVCTAVVKLRPEDSVRETGSSDNPALIDAGSGAGFVGHMIHSYVVLFFKK